IYVDNFLVEEAGAVAGDPGFDKGTSGATRYVSKTNPDHLLNLSAAPGSGAGRLSAKADSSPALPLTVGTDITTQFVNSNACWSTTFTSVDIKSNAAGRF